MQNVSARGGRDVFLECRCNFGNNISTDIKNERLFMQTAQRCSIAEKVKLLLNFYEQIFDTCIVFKLES